jgi:4-hydroxy-tetrahydrodipicolinate synthase
MSGPPLTLRGIYPILSMTFHSDDTVDHRGLIAQSEFLIAAGADGIGFGFGSEIYRLTDQERDDALAAVSRAVDGRAPIIVATSAHSTAATLQRSRAARDAGASILMITPPGMGAFQPEQIFTHYDTIGREIELPIIVQDAPSFSGVAMPEALMERLAVEIDQVIAVKIEVLPPAPKVGRMAGRIGDAAVVLGGAGGIDFIHELERGAAGTIPGAALPELFIAIYRLFDAGEHEQARALFHRFAPLGYLAWRSTDTFLFTQKEILRRRGIIPNARMRHPSEIIDRAYMDELETMLRDLDIDELGASWDPMSHVYDRQ